jgi:shikimate kinase
MPEPHVVLVGMMGSGKTSVGRALAAKLGVPYADNDDALVARTGVDAATFSKERGVPALHALEHELFAAALARPDGAVVSAPGSVALDPAAAGLLHGERVVWLRACLETLAERVRKDPARPLIGADVEPSLRALMSAREPVFQRLATDVVDVDGLDPQEVADRVLNDLSAARAAQPQR